MRIINTGLYSNFRFAIDGHNLTVIANDFVPIEPYPTDNVRYTTSQPASGFQGTDHPPGRSS